MHSIGVQIPLRKGELLGQGEGSVDPLPIEKYRQGGVE